MNQSNDQSILIAAKDYPKSLTKFGLFPLESFVFKREISCVYKLNINTFLDFHKRIYQYIQKQYNIKHLTS